MVSSFTLCCVYVVVVGGGGGGGGGCRRGLYVKIGMCCEIGTYSEVMVKSGRATDVRHKIRQWFHSLFFFPFFSSNNAINVKNTPGWLKNGM